MNTLQTTLVDVDPTAILFSFRAVACLQYYLLNQYWPSTALRQQSSNSLRQLQRELRREADFAKKIAFRVAKFQSAFNFRRRLQVAVDIQRRNEAFPGI